MKASLFQQDNDRTFAFDSIVFEQLSPGID